VTYFGDIEVYLLKISWFDSKLVIEHELTIIASESHDPGADITLSDDPGSRGQVDGDLGVEAGEDQASRFRRGNAMVAPTLEIVSSHAFDLSSHSRVSLSGASGKATEWQPCRVPKLSSGRPTLATRLLDKNYGNSSRSSPKRGSLAETSSG